MRKRYSSGRGNIRSLSREFFWILFFGVIFFFGVLTYMILQREKAIILSIYRDDAARAVAYIAQDLKYSMLEGDSATVAGDIRRHNTTGEAAIGIVGAKGEPAFNTTITVPGDIFAAQRDAFAASGDRLLFYRPLVNEKRCHSCHDPNDKTRGMIVVGISMRRAEEEITKTAERLILMALALGLASEAFLIAVVRRKILNPLGSLNRGARLLKDGRLDHRIAVGSDDEFGALASCFNEMAGSIEKSQTNLENIVRQRTAELRVIAGLSSEVFKGNRTLEEIAGYFLRAITGQLGFGFASLCLLDRETGILSQEITQGAGHGFCAMEMSLASEHPLTNIVRGAEPAIRRAADMGAPSCQADVAVVPILSHHRRKCSEINRCTYDDCPAFLNADERCWLVSDTLCRSPQAVAGERKIYGCLRCPAFPILGVLIAGREGGVAKTSLHSLEILASEMASAIENQRFIEEKKGDIDKLIHLHDVSVASLQNPGAPVANAIVSSSTAFSNTDASILWLLEKEGSLRPVESLGVGRESIPGPLGVEDTFVGRAIAEERVVETVEMKEVRGLEGLAGEYDFRYAASVPLKFKDTVFGCLTLFKKTDFPMSESEKAVTLLFASQAAAAMNMARMYQEITAEKEFSEAIFACASSGIMVLDREGGIMKINSVGAEILHVVESEVAGRKITEIYPEAKEMLVRDMGLGREITVTAPSGRPLPIGFANSALLNSHEVEEGIIVLFKDLTEIKRLQEELKKKEHFATMAQVISGVAHEIRNPLFGISSIGQILERELDSAQHKALAQAMLKESERMRRLIEELLLFTRPSRLDLREVDLGILMDELMHYAKARREGITMDLNVPHPTTVTADKDKIMQVFLNLLNNAIDAAKETIRVSAKTSDGAVMVTVSDDGPGIPRDDLARVFDPFFTTKKGGTGLGLPICRKIVEEHHGTIEIFSGEVGGTTVALRFDGPRPS